MNNKYDIKLIKKWRPPKYRDLHALIAMPNIPKPTHGLAPRTLLGSSTWNYMRKAAYAKANNTCEICGAKPENLRHRHGHEVYEIDYEKGTVKFVRVFCVCSLCHLGCIHSGRALTLYKQNNPLYPKEFLLEGAEHAFKIINKYNKDHPKADLRAYVTFLDYLKCPDLKEPMERLIEKYKIKFYKEDMKNIADWKDWKLIIGNQEYPTPYEDEAAWEEAMIEKSKQDTARKAINRFEGGVYNELDSIIEKATFTDVANGNSLGEAVAKKAMEMAAKDQQEIINKAKEENETSKSN